MRYTNPHLGLLHFTRVGQHTFLLRIPTGEILFGTLMAFIYMTFVWLHPARDGTSLPAPYIRYITSTTSRVVTLLAANTFRVRPRP